MNPPANTVRIFALCVLTTLTTICIDAHAGAVPMAFKPAHFLLGKSFAHTMPVALASLAALPLPPAPPPPPHAPPAPPTPPPPPAPPAPPVAPPPPPPPPSTTSFTILPGASDYTASLQKIFTAASPGATVTFLPGTYNVALGTTYVLNKSINLVGLQATLVNARVIAQANISISGVNFTEQDCTYSSSNPSACPVASPMISIGAAGYSITQATISNVILQYTRAYTGIAVGGGTTQNVNISNFTITDHQLSGITLLNGSNITISGGSITGGTDANVDDGIAIDAATGELSNVSISNVQATNTFDAVGIGGHMYFPLHDITVANTQCKMTAVCIYVKAGDTIPAPAQYAGYSTMDRVNISGVTDKDPLGSRYLSTLWIFAKGGARVSAITVSNVTATTRSASSNTPRVWLFTDATSTISNTQMTNTSFTDIYFGMPNSLLTPGLPTAEGLFIQDQGQAQGVSNIGNLTFTGLTINGTAYYAIDSSQASVLGLSLTNYNFLNVDVAVPLWPFYAIPYSYSLNGAAVL